MPTPDQLFRLANLLVLPCWLALAATLFAPKLHRPTWIVTGLVVPALIAILYVILLARGLSQARPAEGAGFTSLAGIRALFASDAALAAGWLHYLAFDLFVGTAICKLGTEARLHPLLLLPCLPLAFLAGPIGLLLFVVLLAASRRRV